MLENLDKWCPGKFETIVQLTYALLGKKKKKKICIYIHTHSILGILPCVPL